jgi:menaquinone-dependent protoporphyrinogen oxidase
MTNILVTYATAAGSTGEVAEAVGDALRTEGATVEVRRARDVADLSGYDAVVLGTGVRAGNTYAEAASFLERHQQALLKVPMACFVVCLTMKERSEENCRQAEGYLDALCAKAPGLQPVDRGLFGGSLDYQKLPKLLGLIMKVVKKEPAGDYRDWETIRTWAMNLRPALLGS